MNEQRIVMQLGSARELTIAVSEQADAPGVCWETRTLSKLARVEEGVLNVLRRDHATIRGAAQFPSVHPDT